MRYLVVLLFLTVSLWSCQTLAMFQEQDTLFDYYYGALTHSLNLKSRELWTKNEENMDRLIGLSDDDLTSVPYDKTLLAELEKTLEHYKSVLEDGLAAEKNVTVQLRPFEKRLVHALYRAHKLLNDENSALVAYNIDRLLEFNEAVLPFRITEQLYVKRDSIISDATINREFSLMRSSYAVKRAQELVQLKESLGHCALFLIDLLLEKYRSSLSELHQNSLREKQQQYAS